MAKKNRKKNPSRDTLDIISASLYGLSPEFIRQNDEIIDNTRKILADKLSPFKHDKKNKNNEKPSNVVEFVKVLSSTMHQEERMDVLNSLKNSEVYSNPSGTHSISEDSRIIDRLSDAAVVDELVAGVQNHFALMPEYAKICQIIPELDRCVDIIVKDIINRDEFSHSFVHNFYHDSDNSANDSVIEDRIKELLDEYDFEGRVRRWIRDSEVTGCKPFSVLPQDDVISMLNQEIDRRKGILPSTTIESLNIGDLVSEEDLMLKSPIINIYDNYNKLKLGIIGENDKSHESIRLKVSVENDAVNFAESILTPDIIDEWAEVCKENIGEMFDKVKMSYANKDPKDYDEFVKSYESFKTDLNNPKFEYEKNDIIKKELTDLVVALDQSIEVVDPMKAPLYQAKKKIKNVFYKTVDNKGSKKAIDDFYRVDDGNEIQTDKRKNKKSFVIDGFEIEVGDEKIDEKEYNKKNNTKRAILTEYEPEHVIPVSAGGTHIGYYIVEYVRTNGDNFLLLKRDRGSFADIIRRLGVSEDKALVANTGTTAVDSNNPFSSGAFSPSTIMSPILSGSSGGPMYGGQFQGGTFGNNGQCDRKMSLIKGLLIKIITKRLGDESLVENGTFQSALMNLIRDDLLWKNRVRFTFIPESHMVYMNRELDSDGFPLSIFDGTLFNCYTYIASLISSLMMKVMKSSDTEVMEVNVGRSKELGLTIGAISQNASSRNVCAKTLFGGTDNIVRSVGNFKRIIVPVVNGEKLYDVTQLERVNNVDIDDEFTERMLKSVIMKIGVPPTSLDMLDQDEYVASQTQHRIDYRNLIVDRGVNYSKYVTKAIRLLVKYSDISVPSLKMKSGNKSEINENSEMEIDIGKIEFDFTPPKNLTVNKITEEIGSVSSLVDDIITMYYGEDDREGEEWPTLKLVTKKLLMRELSSSTDWSMIDEIIKTAKLETPKIHAEMTKQDIPTSSGADEDEGGDDEGGGGYGF